MNICHKCSGYNFHGVLNNIKNNNDCNMIIDKILAIHKKKLVAHKCIYNIIDNVLNNNYFVHLYPIVVFKNITRKSSKLQLFLCFYMAKKYNYIYDYLTLTKLHICNYLYEQELDNINDVHVFDIIISHILSCSIDILCCVRENIINDFETYMPKINVDNVYKSFVNSCMSHRDDMLYIHQHFQRYKVNISLYTDDFIYNVIHNSRTCNIFHCVGYEYTDKQKELIEYYNDKSDNLRYRDLILYANLETECSDFYKLIFKIKNTNDYNALSSYGYIDTMLYKRYKNFNKVYNANDYDLNITMTDDFFKFKEHTFDTKCDNIDINTQINISYALVCIWHYSMFSNNKKQSSASLSIKQFRNIYKKIILHGTPPYSVSRCYIQTSVSRCYIQTIPNFDRCRKVHNQSWIQYFTGLKDPNIYFDIDNLINYLIDTYTTII